MCLIIKNGNVTTREGSQKGDIGIKDGKLFMNPEKVKAPKVKVIDASKVVSESIVHWFTTKH
ncbi:hypothetical protein JCM16358_06040 [Halanaerocella petrolearia]